MNLTDPLNPIDDAAPAAVAWKKFKGNRTPHDEVKDLPPPPLVRRFKTHYENKDYFKPDREVGERSPERLRGSTFRASEAEINLVNVALLLRRPLLITGKPGTGKSSLAYAIAYELKLGKVLYWSITSRASLDEALYRYDAIGRLQEANLTKTEPDIGNYISLGPLGTALLPTERPQVLLIDEIDKSNIDLPNDLLNIFESGWFEIPEITRLSEEQRQTTVKVQPMNSQRKFEIKYGRVACNTFPIVVITSNGERELPPPFLRRCVRLEIQEPDPRQLAEIVHLHLSRDDELSDDDRQRVSTSTIEDLVDQFVTKREEGDLATDQLLNAVYLTSQGVDLETVVDETKTPKEKLIDAVLKHLSRSERA